MIPYSPPAPATSIPLVDLSVGGGAEGRRAIAREIHKACRDSGFFYVSGHGVSQALIDAQFEWSRRFFDLDQAGKQALHMARSASHAGYEPIGAQTLDTDAPPDLKEAFYVNHDLPGDHAYVVRGIRGYGGNQWPASLPGFRAQMLAYYAAMDVLAR